MSHILLKLPTRSRPDKAVGIIKQYISTASGQNKITYLVSLDIDDPTCNEATIKRFTELGCVVRTGLSTGKVSAINRDINEWLSEGNTFDILVATADDMVPAQGWDAVISEAMLIAFPTLDGGMRFNDGLHNKLMTLPVIGYAHYLKLGYVYHPDYTSLWCDNEMEQNLVQLGKLVHDSRIPIKHVHFTAVGGDKADELAIKNETYYWEDKKVFDRRRALKAPGSSFGFEFPAIKLSLLICSLQSRRAMRQGLMDKLAQQINASPYRRLVEVRVLEDTGEAHIGAKRNALLNESHGEYVAFIDDDDDIADNYISSIMDALLLNAGVDCVSFNGVMTVNGASPQIFKLSIGYGSWYVEGGVYYRTPNHICPVRRELAIKAGFPDTSYGEDAEYSKRLLSVGMKSEVLLEQSLYFYLFNTSSGADKDKRRTEKPKRTARERSQRMTPQKVERVSRRAQRVNKRLDRRRPRGR